MTTDRQIELIEELADKCCVYHDLHTNQKSCMGCWRRTNGCEKFLILNKLVEEGCKIVPKGEWLQTENYYAYKCSCCGEITRQPNDKYCSNCGAVMKFASDNDRKTAKWEFWEGWIGNHDMRIEDATCSNCGYAHPTVRRALIDNKFKSGETPQDILNKLSDTCLQCGAKMIKE